MTEIILTSSVLIVVLALLRRLLRGRMDPRLQYALWLLVALRLLIPGTLFPAPVSVAGAAEDLRVSIQQAFPGPADLTADPAADLANQPAQPPQALTPDGHTTVYHRAPPEIARRTYNWPDILWKAGIALVGGALVLSNLRFYLRLRKSRKRLNLPREAGAGRLPVYLAEDLASPCLFGLFRPAIYLPPQALEAGRLNHVLTHELTHFRHGDHLWALLRSLCLALHWYNPLVWQAAALSRRDCELACDDGVIRRLGEDHRLDYGDTLLYMVAAGRPNLLRTATTMSDGKRTMAERIALIARRPRMLKATLALVAAALCAVVVVTFGGAAESAPAEDSQSPAPGTEDPLPPEEENSRPLSAGRLTSTDYVHPSGLFSLTLPDNWPEEVRCVETADAAAFYEAGAYDAEAGQGWLMSVVPQPASWAEVYDQSGTPLGEFDSSGSPYVYMLDLNPEPAGDSHTQSLLDQRDQLVRSFRGQTGAEDFSRLVRDAYRTDMPLAIAYLPYLNWASYDELYGEEELWNLLSALMSYVELADPDWDQYHDILSNRSRYQPIDGAYATAIQEGILWPLYEKNPQRFASVLGSAYLTDDERADVLEWIRYPLSLDQGRVNFPEEALTDEEMYAVLGLTPGAGGVTASPSARTLTSAGERFSFLPENTAGVYAAEYSSSDPSVASVDREGTVTAVSPGQAVITLHFEGSGGQWDFTCAVTCSWTEGEPEGDTGDPAATLYGSTYGWELMDQWQRQLFGLTFAVPALPDQEQIYDDGYADGLERSLLDLLESHGQAYLGDDFDSVILDSALPLHPEYREEVAVSYRFVAAREFQFPDGQTVRLTQDSPSLETTFTVMGLSRVRGDLLVGGPDLYGTSELANAVITGADSWNLAYIYQDILSRTQAQLLANPNTADYTVLNVELIDDGALDAALLDIRAGDTLEVTYNIGVESPDRGGLGVGTFVTTYTFAE